MLPKKIAKLCEICSCRDEMLDRFIPPRTLQSGEPRWNGLKSLEEVLEDVQGTSRNVLGKCLGNRGRRAYRCLLSDTLFGGRRADRVLPLGWPLPLPLGRGPGVAAADAGPEKRDWAVRPRSDPLIGAPQLKLNLPDLSKSQTERHLDQLVDWGACGVLAVAGFNDVYLWRHPGEGPSHGSSSSGSSELLVHFDDHHPTALCWSHRPDQALLAIGTAGICRVQIWDCSMKRQLFYRRLPDGAPPTSITWHPFDDVIAVGTSWGVVHLLTATLALIKSQQVYHNAGGISTLSFSPDGSLLACGGTGGTVLVWDWETGMVGGDEIDAGSVITSLCWHPWRGAVLVVAGTLMGTIILFNFSSRLVKMSEYDVGTQNGDRPPLSTTALSFSQRTGELVAAFHGKGVVQVVVLSDLTTVVDRLVEHTDAVSFICWSPDGANLATAGADDMLCLWDFLGAKATRELKKRALQETREVRSGIKRQFGCIIR